MMLEDCAIVLVDEDAFQRKLLARQLANLGVGRTDCFASIDTALAEFDRGLALPQLVFLHVDCEAVDGPALVGALSARGFNGGLVLLDGAGGRVPAAVAEAAAEHTIALLGLLQRPARPSRLLALLERWQRSRPNDGNARADAVTPAGRYTAGAIRAAIERGELLNHYQPKVSIATGEVTGVEALVRWRHPTDGQLPPAQFIHLAEAYGLIDALTVHVLERALADAAQWHAAGLDLPVAVNVSMGNLRTATFPDQVCAALDRAGVAASGLTLEVAEARLKRDTDSVLGILGALHGARVSLSVDDFGIGLSRLEALRTLPFGEIKIDRNVVGSARGNPALQAIIAHSLAIAHEMGITAVAEGVEELADWTVVGISGCDEAQGWFIARPMATAELPSWCVSWARRRLEVLKR